jgi:hypothetical protein
VKKTTKQFPKKQLTATALVQVRGAGLITEIGFPACDGAGKDPAYMTLK